MPSTSAFCQTCFACHSVTNGGHMKHILMLAVFTAVSLFLRGDSENAVNNR